MRKRSHSAGDRLCAFHSRTCAISHGLQVERLGPLRNQASAPNRVAKRTSVWIKASRFPR